jgi:hypothetical protein
MRTRMPLPFPAFAEDAAQSFPLVSALPSAANLRDRFEGGAAGGRELVGHHRGRYVGVFVSSPGEVVAETGPFQTLICAT